MFAGLTDEELAVLQEMLYVATAKAYAVAATSPETKHAPGRYQRLHAELACLFLEAGELLVARLDTTREMAGAR